MIVLHALWEIDTGLHLWAESSEVLLGTVRRGKKIGPQDHSFLLAHNSLAKLVAGLSGNWDPARLSPVLMRLPSTDDGPIPSEECLGTSISDAIGASHRVRLATWRIDTFTLAPAVALDFLSSMESHPPGGVDYGSSLRFWTETSKLALELVAREKSILPAIREENRGESRCFKATWEVVIEGENLERVKSICDLMPPCCRAIRYPEGKSPSPSALIQNFLSRTIDSFIRQSLASNPSRYLALNERKRFLDRAMGECAFNSGKSDQSECDRIGKF